MTSPLYSTALPDGIRARIVANGNGLDMHVLEAGDAGCPPVLLLHGFPELAYSWRKVMPALAAAGYHVIAPDQRGYGLTTGWDDDYDGDLSTFRFLNLLRDTLGLLDAMEILQVDLVGHDFGSFAAAHFALIRPDVFKSVVMMSAPYAGPPSLRPAPAVDIDADLAALPRPRKHYHRYYSTRPANDDMWHAPQGVHDFLRAYFHHKSADWPENRPHRLTGWTANELAKLPTYYVMDLDRTMAETVAPEMPDADAVAACAWLPDDELRVYSDTFGRTGFQGGLNWYRCRFVDAFTREQEVFAGRTIDAPAMFVSGQSDWGTYQTPGALEALETRVCMDYRGTHLVPGAGHWVQQEQPDAVSALLLDFLKNTG
ncbi:MAG: alpha/beta hydrolase [Rhodospirillales bacterium]|nr:alpha/beta hydrolase [Rhodospirillales bacterium]MBO6786530.1 alpha/beta hydrolase [Rhodospirillales bacterium]